MTHLSLCSRPEKEMEDTRNCDSVLLLQSTQRGLFIFHLPSASSPLDLDIQAPESWCPLIYLDP